MGLVAPVFYMCSFLICFRLMDAVVVPTTDTVWRTISGLKKPAPALASIYRYLKTILWINKLRLLIFSPPCFQGVMLWAANSWDNTVSRLEQNWPLNTSKKTTIICQVLRNHCTDILLIKRELTQSYPFLFQVPRTFNSLGRRSRSPRSGFLCSDVRYIFTSVSQKGSEKKKGKYN